jgi:hypothetical protein
MPTVDSVQSVNPAYAQMYKVRANNDTVQQPQAPQLAFQGDEFVSEKKKSKTGAVLGLAALAAGITIACIPKARKPIGDWVKGLFKKVEKASDDATKKGQKTAEGAAQKGEEAAKTATTSKRGGKTLTDENGKAYAAKWDEASKSWVRDDAKADTTLMKNKKELKELENIRKRVNGHIDRIRNSSDFKKVKKALDKAKIELRKARETKDKVVIEKAQTKYDSANQKYNELLSPKEHLGQLMQYRRELSAKINEINKMVNA